MKTSVSDKKSRRLGNLLIASLLAGAMCPLPALAADNDTVIEPETEAGTQGARIYRPADFSQFSPRNALDMLGQVPGFSINGGDQGRGLGQASVNVVINGERLALKSESVFDRLSKIAADRVERIEIVDGAVFGIPGLSGQVANIVTRDTGGITGQFEWNSTFRPGYVRPEWFGGNVSVSGTTKTLEYTLALSNDTGRGALKGPLDVTDADGNLIEHRETHLANVYDSPKIAATLKWDGPGTSVGNFNATYQRTYFNSFNDEDRTRTDGNDSHRDYDPRERTYNYELGGDYEFPLGPGRLKLIGLERYERSRYSEDAVYIYADGSPNTGGRYASRSESGERIGRGEYSWAMLGGEWQVAGEAAFNRFNGEAHLYDLDPTGTEFVEVPFPGGTGGVTEDRYEVIVTHSRKFSDTLSLQAGIGGEYSKLAQTGANGLVRTFWRPKGSLALAWTPSKDLDLSLKVERAVGQLSFGDFLARTDLDQGQDDAGNEELVPSQEWDVDLEAKKDLGKWGSTNLRVFYRGIDDYLDVIPLGNGLESTGNINFAYRYGLEWTSTFELAPLGWKGAKLDTSVRLGKSRVDDPLTGEPRDFSNYGHRHIEANLRHDIPGSNWAWGAGIQYDHRTPYYRLYETGQSYEGPIYTEAFVENKDVFGLTVRASVFNITGGKHYYYRTVYDGPRDTSPVLYREEAVRPVGFIYNLTVKGNF